MLRTVSLTLLLIASALVPACGGGGGGDGGEPPSAPGTLRTLALEGLVAPGTAGVFAAFATYPLMDAANGGWCAFVAPTTDALMPEVLYVAQPDDVPTVVRVFAVGDLLPPGTPSDGVIGAFDRIWMCPDGTVVAHVGVDLDSGGRTFAVLSARVTGGAAIEKATMITDGDDLSGAGGTGDLVFLDAATACKANDGTLWFLGEDGGNGNTDLWSVRKDGTGLTRRAFVGLQFEDAMGIPNGQALSIDAFAIDAAGSIFCFVATADAGPARRMVVKTAVGASLNLEFFRTGDVMPSGVGTVLDPYKGGDIIVFPNGQVVWVAQGNQGGVDDVLLVFTPIPAPVSYAELIRSTDTATDTAGGQHAVIDTLNMARSCDFPQFLSSILGSGSGVTQGTFAVFDTAGNHTLDSSDLAISGGGLVPASWIDLGNTMPRYDDASQNGSFLFTQAFAGTSALFWLIRGGGTFAIAAEGGSAPDGAVFGPFEPSSAHTVADGTALFRADVTPGGSGIFRQGP